MFRQSMKRMLFHPYLILPPVNNFLDVTNTLATIISTDTTVSIQEEN